VNFGFVFAIASYGAIGVITSGTLALILTPIAAIGGVIPPALQGVMSRRVDANAQGELQGALTSTTALAMILSPLAMTASFSEFTKDGTTFYLPGAPFLLAMALSILALAIFVFSPRKTT